MAQNRPPPAFQEYAASMLSSMTFRMMSLQSRGLLYTIRLEYWIGNPLPSNPEKLSRVLGLSNSEVGNSLLELGELVRIDQGFLKVPELDDYKNHLEDRHRKQSEGGKEGARRSKEKSNQFKQVENSDDYSKGDLQVPCGSTRGSLVKSNPVQSNSTQISQVTNEADKEWIEDYDRTPIQPYRKNNS